MVKINTKIPQKNASGEALLVESALENGAVPSGAVTVQRATKRRCAEILLVTALVLCTVTLGVGFWLKSHRHLPQFCCDCKKMSETSVGNDQEKVCCINTESEYIRTMKHMLSSYTDNDVTPTPPQDPRRVIAEKEKKMLEAKEETITLLHASPIAAHVLVASTNSSFYPMPKEIQNLPPTRTLTLLPRRSLSLLRGVDLRKDHLIIRTRGLYLIYSQIYFKVIQGTNWPRGLKLLCHIVERYSKRLPNDGIEKLLQSTYTLSKRTLTGDQMFDFHTSYVSGVVQLEVNDEVFVRASVQDVISRYPTLNYIGLVKLDGE